ncbi:MAG: endonuclease MutS2 [Saprospiraceae bacterium]
MQLIPTDVHEKLEFDKVIELLEKQCLGELGIERIRNLKIHTSATIIDTLLTEVLEYVTAIEDKHRFPISAYYSISEDLKVLAIEGYVLGVEALQRINTLMLQIRDIYLFFKKHKNEYKKLYDIIKETSFDEDLIKSIMRVIDEEGKIRPDASNELMTIRRKTNSKRKDLDKTFRSVISLYASKGWLTDTKESYRNGRRVLAVPAEFKRKIRGIIHDESATGKTSFIEPEVIIDINNDLFDLEQEERREIHKILRDLSDEIRPYTGHLAQYQTILVRFDVIQAKAAVANQMDATKPIIKDHPFIAIQQGFHPLLLLKNKSEGKKTVPFKLVFHNNNRILVLSGPNAGGKSIAMKSIGLIQMMTQAGLLTPLDKESEIGVFDNIFADIGDQQSLEDDLSTYSSRLKNAKAFVENANDKTLILIDEFGSGTDPKIGGAIAEAVLNELNNKKIFGVITTHYSNIKIFAFKTKGIVNGSMQFDKDTLSPSYKMKVGRPGSSFAYEIAEKTGLSNRILKYAKHKTGKNEKAVDELLVDLQRGKQELEDQISASKKREGQLEKLIIQYERMAKDYEYKRKKLKLDIKEQEMQQQSRTNKQVERLVREIKEEKNLEKAKKLATQVRQESKQVVEKVEKLREEIYYKTTEKKAVKLGEIKIGDFVKLRTGGSTGTVESITKKEAMLQMGLMRMRVKLRDLQHANAPMEIVSQKRVNTDTVSRSATFEPKIDVRGMRRDEVLESIQGFMDEAIVSSANLLEIIHGKGNGILRKAVRSKVREYSDVLNIYHQQNNDGVTMVEL